MLLNIFQFSAFLRYQYFLCQIQLFAKEDQFLAKLAEELCNFFAKIHKYLYSDQHLYFIHPHAEMGLLELLKLRSDIPQALWLHQTFIFLHDILMLSIPHHDINPHLAYCHKNLMH